jgi:hypothetical protein
LLGEIEALKKQLEPDIFWDDEDPKQSRRSIDDVVFYRYHIQNNICDEIEIRQAVRLKNVMVKITEMPEDGEDGEYGDIEWELVNERK